MKRAYVILFIFMCWSLLGFAQEKAALKYVGATPASGSEIAVDEEGNFNIVLEFDLSDIIAQYGESEDYGIGYQGMSSSTQGPRGATLYEGGQDGTFIQIVNNNLVHGKSAVFKRGNTIDISFTGVTLIPGQTYTVVWNALTRVWVAGTVTGPGDPIKYNDEPLVLTYIAKKVDTGVVLESCSLAQNTELESLGVVSYRFNNEVEAVDGAVARIMEGETLVAERPLTVSASDGKEVTVDFGGEPAYKNRQYTLELPAGSLRLKGGDAVNIKNSVGFTGSYVGHFRLESSTPADNATALTNSITLTFDIPDPAVKLYASSSDLYIDLYAGEVSEGTFIRSLKCKENGVSDDGHSVTFVIDEWVTPATTYVFDIPADRLRVKRNNSFDYGWTNEAVRVSFTSPAVDEVDFPAMEFEEPVIGKYGASTRVLSPDDPVESLNVGVEIALKGNDNHQYVYEDPALGLSIKASLSLVGDGKGYLYDITSGTETLVSEFRVKTEQRETAFAYYNVIHAVPSGLLFDGHRYKMVIPAGEFAIGHILLRNYVRSPELSYEFQGAVPEAVTVVGCSVDDGAKFTSLCNVVYTFNGNFEFDSSKQAILSSKFVNAAGMEIEDRRSFFLTHTGDWGKIMAHIYNSSTGTPLELVKDRDYTLTLPAGTMYYAGDPTICNADHVLHIRGSEPEPVFTEPEYVDLTVTVNGAHSSVNKTVKGQRAEVRFTPDEFWTVWRVSRDGNDVTGFVQNGAYTTPALEESTTVEATMAYTGQFMVEQTSGVFTVPGSPVTVRTEEGVIIVEGVTPDDTITVYTVSGMVISNITPELGVVRISVDPGQVYIVRVNQRAAKVRP